MNKMALKEKRVHGTDFFPLGIYEMHREPEEIVLDCHWHDEWEFLLVTEGKALFQVDNKYYTVEKNQAIFVKNASLHGGYPVAPVKCSYKAVVFHPKLIAIDTVDPLQIAFIEPFLNGNMQFPDFIAGRDVLEREIICILKNIFLLCDNKTFGYELQVRAFILMIWSILLSNRKFTQKKAIFSNTEKSLQIKRALTYIHDNYQNNITTPVLASHVNMSEGYFCRFFKSVMHMTPIEYIQKYRIKAAAEELKKDKQQITEVAYNCGFHNLSYFNQIFKRYIKCTPSVYRNRQLDK